MPPLSLRTIFTEMSFLNIHSGGLSKQCVFYNIHILFIQFSLGVQGLLNIETMLINVTLPLTPCDETAWYTAADLWKAARSFTKEAINAYLNIYIMFDNYIYLQNITSNNHPVGFCKKYRTVLKKSKTS